jgi:hypothetical protein
MLSFSLFNMTATYRLQLLLYIIIYVELLLTTTIVNAFEYGKYSIMIFIVKVFLSVVRPRIYQKILVGPHNVNAHPGETIQFPCIVSKQSAAVVTWCWNDFCTLGKAQLLRHETTHDGLISIYQYTAYPRFQLLINERLSMYKNYFLVNLID